MSKENELNQNKSEHLNIAKKIKLKFWSLS